MPFKCAICGKKSEVTTNFMEWPDIENFHAEFYPVTKGGNPAREVLGFICAVCLHNAKNMRVFIKTYLSGVMVTEHAIQRFLERSGAEISDEQVGKVALLKAFSKARRIRFRVGLTAKHVINQNFDSAEYYFNNNLIFVVRSGHHQTIVTVEQPWGRKLGRDFFYED